MVVVGAGASFDSISARPVGRRDPDEMRPPLADHPFDPRGPFEVIQRHLPRMMAVVPNLFRRPDGQSVEDVLARYSDEANTNSERLIQLAAIRYYIQTVIGTCENGWYRNSPVPMNMMALVDQMEQFRSKGDRPFLVTFNYDRIIEAALGIRDRTFVTLDDYVPSDDYQVFKLHGSVDWL